MKTLKESLLDDIDKTMKAGDKMHKTYQLVENELKWVQEQICDFTSTMYDFNWYKGGSGRMTGNIYDWRMLVKTPRLSKFFNMKGKNLFFMVSLNSHGEWHIGIVNTSASKPVIDKQYQTMRVNSDKVSLHCTIKDTTFVRNEHKSKHSIEEIITNYLAPIFGDMKTFKEKVVIPSLEATISGKLDVGQVTI